MKIRVAILDADIVYLERMVNTFNARYADSLVIYSFTDADTAFKQIEKNRIDVLIASEQYEINIELLPRKCGFAYFVDSHDIEFVKNQAVICKYQKADLIYKQILSLYSEMAVDISGRKPKDAVCNIIAFASPCGGVGTSTFAAVCAAACAKKGHKVLHLNIEAFGSSDAFFCADGKFDLSDVIYALKSKKANLAIKIESCVKQDKTGVYFFSPPKTALDLMELKDDDIIDLLAELQISGGYDRIILDMDFSLERCRWELLEKADTIVMVGDGSSIANEKIYRAYETLKMIEQGRESLLLDKVMLIYNKFSNKTGRTLEQLEIKTLGGAPRYEHAASGQIVEQLLNMSLFDEIIS